MKILFSLDVSNQRQVDFCNRILKILNNKDYNNDITLICKSQKHLSDYLYIPPSSHIKTEEAEIILTYGKTGLSHISQFARKSNIPIIHFINTEYLKDEYLSEDQQVEKIILCDCFNQLLESFFQKDKMFVLPYFSKPVVTKNVEIRNKNSPKLLIAIAHPNLKNSPVYYISNLLNILSDYRITILYNGDPLIPIFNSNITLINVKESNIEKVILSNDIIIGDGISIYTGIMLGKPCIVIGEQGYGGLITPQNLSQQFANKFQGRIGGSLNEYIPLNLIMNDIQYVQNTEKSKNIDCIIIKNKELLDNEYRQTQQLLNDLILEVAANHKQLYTFPMEIHLRLSDAFHLIKFSDTKFVLAYTANNKVHSSFGKEEAEIIALFKRSCLIKDAINMSPYKKEPKIFVEFIQMLFNEKILIA
ncbi:hypothetical protein AE938_00105 [Bacteroides fragilis]|uniref:hypothetical protein n=1 Tax=Bacteroides fragilis TaxID=817 RepID=UPI001CA8AC1E|nr:hypothetical protein [Bacteroides fragilis]MBY2897275.1 hypothetical protein [Bacteroides fragilis]MCM0328255.1 hypothetical protein [Bacteroides fragilis]